MKTNIRKLILDKESLFLITYFDNFGRVQFEYFGNEDKMKGAFAEYSSKGFRPKLFIDITGTMKK